MQKKQLKWIIYVVLVLWFTCVVSYNMQTLIKHNAALHNMSETYLKSKGHVSVNYFLGSLVSNAAALHVLTHLQIAGAWQTCQMAKMERLHR